MNLGTRTFTIPVREKTPCEPPATGWMWKKVGDVTHAVELTIDLDKLFAKLGPKAAAAKLGRAVECSGAIVCRRVKGGAS